MTSQASKNQNNSKEPPWWSVPPAICRPLLPIERIDGQQNVNPVWSGEVLELQGAREGESYRCVFKLLDDIRMPIEMACALSATILGNDVPQPCVVVAKVADLPGAPQRLAGQDEVLLFGSYYLKQDAFFEQLASLDTNDALAKAVWNSFCNDATKAAGGAALDELIANFDRHARNLRFDGVRWWLIDHDMSLRETHGKDIQQMQAGFKSAKNLIAAQLLDRRRSDHDMAGAARRSLDKLQTLLSIAAKARQWTHADARVVALWKSTATLLDLMGRRLPMLPSLIDARIGATSTTALQWTPPPP